MGCAATATAHEANTLRVSLPPKPPPMRLTRATTLCAGTPVTLATSLCVLVTACVDAMISRPFSDGTASVVWHSR